MQDWLAIALVVLVAIQLLVLVGLVLNVNKLLDRATSIRRQLREQQDDGVGAQLTEATAQLGSIAVSIDRVALRCDALDERVGELAGMGGGAGKLSAETAAVLAEAVEGLREPLHEIRDLLGRTKTERLADEVKRTLHNMGFDRVTIKTDLATLEEEDARVQVEVARDGVTSKGYVVIRDGGVVDQKITRPYEMFP